jgi:hypothetical protein
VPQTGEYGAVVGVDQNGFGRERVLGRRAAGARQEERRPVARVLDVPQRLRADRGREGDGRGEIVRVGGPDEAPDAQRPVARQRRQRAAVRAESQVLDRRAARLEVERGPRVRPPGAR